MTLFTKLSRTWQTRTKRLAAILGAFVVLALVSGAAITDYTTIKRWADPPTPVTDIATAAARGVVSDTAQITAFAEHCVPTILMATATTNLGACNPREHAYRIDPHATITTIATGARASYPKYEGTANGVQFYAVKVIVEVRANAGSTPDLEYFSIPVAVGETTAPVAVDRVTRLDPPPPGPAVSLGYPTDVKDGTDIHGVLTGFITALLADTGDLNRYITTDSGITPIGGYARDSITITAALDGDPADNAQLGAHIDVSAARAAHAFTTRVVGALTTGTDQLSYSVTLRSVDGTWFVAGIDAMPLAQPQQGDRKPQ